MFELKFAAEVSDLAGTWAVGVLALGSPCLKTICMA